MRGWLCCLFAIIVSNSWGQSQSCPVNINFSNSTLTHWSAYTGNNADGNGPSAIKENYDAVHNLPLGTIGATSIKEYSLPSVNGIEVNTANLSDEFGNFTTIPTINGYQYKYSIKLGSTAVSRQRNGNSTGYNGGYIRGVSYQIHVPPGSSLVPYTMTYAYAMVLENGTHNSDQQPLFSATLRVKDSIVECASPSYFLPTFNDAFGGDTGATLDTATAKKNGFALSPVPSPNPVYDYADPTKVYYIKDVWTKGWTEVTFDLSAFRGQDVTLTFEADNCVLGGHFAYAYVALRDVCGGLLISGDQQVCQNSEVIYSVPALAGAVYHWNVPAGWKVSNDTTNILHVITGKTDGAITVNEVNSCANLKASINAKILFPADGGKIIGDTSVCEGTNVEPLRISNYSGGIVKWISTTDSVHWQEIANKTDHYTASNLSTTTWFSALVQNGTQCKADTSDPAIVQVDRHSIGGLIDPAKIDICDGQQIHTTLSLKGTTGSVLKWQTAQDNITWADVAPSNVSSTFDIAGLPQSTNFRAIIKSGVCPADTSSIAEATVYHVQFPQTSLAPSDTTLCYGTPAKLKDVISVGSAYQWLPSSTLQPSDDGAIAGLPFLTTAIVKPDSTTDYYLMTSTAGCPNARVDTFHVHVLPKINVFAGNDTSIVTGQALQLHAEADDSTVNKYNWSPSTGLDNAAISNPVALLFGDQERTRYVVRATNTIGCFGEDDIVVRVFKTLPDIFVPNAFTPGKSSNNIFKPIPVGITQLRYFRIFSRWGDLVFSTNQIGQGWDGMLNGRVQAPDTYVWTVEGVDFTGRTISKKGTMVLVR